MNMKLEIENINIEKNYAKIKSIEKNYKRNGLC